MLDLTGHTGEADFEMPLAVATVQPEHGALKGGQTIQVFGTGFTGAEAVEFVPTAGGAALPAKNFKVESDNEITVETPDASGALEKGKHSLLTDVQVTDAGAKSPIAAPADRYTFGSTHKLSVSVTGPSGDRKPASSWRSSLQKARVSKASPTKTAATAKNSMKALTR